MIVKIDELIDQFSGLLECSDFLPIDALGFEDRKEIFCHRIIITVPTS